MPPAENHTAPFAFRVELDPAVGAALRRLTAAQQKSVDRKVAAAARLAGLRQHPGGEEWLDISAGPVVLECRVDDRLRVLSIHGVRNVLPRR